MGIFGTWAPEYAERGVAVFPVDVDAKKPLVTNYGRAGVRASARWAERFADADGLGIHMGCNALTIIDVDTTDERVFCDAMDRHGPSPFVVQTQSGGWQAYYANNGEKRQTRAWPSIDLLGNGQAVAAPSRGRKGAYRVIAGDLDDLLDLPTLRDIPAGLYRPKAANDPKSSTGPAVGQRNQFLFDALRYQGQRMSTYEQLEASAMMLNQTFAEPLTAAGVVNTALQIWKYKTEGRLFVSGCESTSVFPDSLIDQCLDNCEAIALLHKLRKLHAHHKGRSFELPAATGNRIMGWSRGKYMRARNHLVAIGRLELVQEGSKGKRTPTIARLPSC